MTKQELRKMIKEVVSEVLTETLIKVLIKEVRENPSSIGMSAGISPDVTYSGTSTLGGRKDRRIKGEDDPDFEDESKMPLKERMMKLVGIPVNKQVLSEGQRRTVVEEDDTDIDKLVNDAMRG